jgi:hypothetical protein
MGYWSCILPEAGTNLVLNPVAMGTGNYTNVATGAVTLVTTYSYLGYKCFRMTGAANNDGAYWSLSTLANAIHYVTIRVHSASDITPMFDMSLDNATYNTPTLLATEGSWYIYGYQFPAAQASGSVRLYILQNGAGAIDMYIGHIQVEQNTYATTPITGDLKGFCSDGYYWNGAPHLSSSTRAAKERSGGLEVDLETSYNFRVLYGEGSGMPPITHHAQGMALLPGGLFQGSKVEPRVLDLVSGTKVRTVATVEAARKNFINAIKPDRVSPEQPVVFRYSGVNANKPVEFYCYYDSGMEFQLSSGIIDKPVARFICYDPFVYETHSESAVLTTSASVADADYIMRKVNGTWYNISTQFDSWVMALARGIDGCIYIGGAFANVGAPTGDYIIKWNPFTSTISSLTGGSGSGTDNMVRALAVAPNGDVYFGGDFHLAGAITNTVHIAYWDISASEFVALSTGLSAGCYSLIFGQDGSLYIGGTFTNVGDTNGDYIVKWTGSAWVSLGTGMNERVLGLACAPNGDIYAAGYFSLAGGVSGTAYISKWNGSAWTPLGTGLNGYGYTLAIDKAGNIYVGGSFTTADGVACNNIAKWNGKTFEPLGSGLNNTCKTLSIDSNGLLYAGGTFTSAGGITLSDRIAIWNGTVWAHLDTDFPGSSDVVATSVIGNNIYLGYLTEGTATSSYLNTVTNNGSTSAYPVIKIKRADDGTTAVLEWIKNETTGDTLWCNYSLLKGETLTIDLTPGSRSIKSDFFGDVWRAVLRSSDLSSFRLLPGPNSISVFVNPTGSPTITAWLEWKIPHWSADTVAA